MKDYKRILDSVHGYIYIERLWMILFVDNPYFQRLRRIEQTSGRSIYPSARHDRFIHSLGVFHLGTLIVNSIKSKSADFDYDCAIHDVYFNSYRIACLLHDCGHTPFSHTFENYFKHGEDELPMLLCEELNDKESFLLDCKDNEGRYIKVAPHEYLSAILALKKFKRQLVSINAIPDLVARMITGIQYKEGHCFENCLITLIHGDVLDADRLDYVCRDRWASGYSTSTVDVERLIKSIHIKQVSFGNYKVCYDPSVIHDIEGVLNVKEFQQMYVINHHTVCYEQYLLQKAMENTAYRILNKNQDPISEEDGTLALKKICSPNIMWDGLKINGTTIPFLMDDDFICLMKQHLNNKYVQQWFSRRYQKHLLWKNKSEFYSIFYKLRGEALDKDSSIYRLCDPMVLSLNFNELHSDDFLRLDANEKKTVISDNLNIILSNGNVLPYLQLFPTKNGVSSENCFFYLYLSDGAYRNREKVIDFLRKYM